MEGKTQEEDIVNERKSCSTQNEHILIKQITKTGAYFIYVKEKNINTWGQSYIFGKLMSYRSAIHVN